MSPKRLTLFAMSALFAFACTASPSFAEKYLRITIPKHTELTPVQRLNREGVDAILKHRYEIADGLFYKAYLYDPADPFTLTNLGYVSELQGQVDRAQKFYKLAGDQQCLATIERSSAKQLDGKPMMDALGTLKTGPMRVNRLNVLGMEMLSQDRGFEAVAFLKEALALDPQNPFTLNNLGVAHESTGDLESALAYYDQAAASHSTEPVVVTRNLAWRGKSVSVMAAESASNLRKRMKNMDHNQVRAAMLATLGVYAINHNNWTAAKQDFTEAYALDPESAFALNNLGYMTAHDGDFETAKSYYARARKADDAGVRVGLATQTIAQGQPLATIADDNHQDMDVKLESATQNHLGQNSSFELKRRSGESAQPDAAPKAPSLLTRPSAPAAQLPQ